VNPLTGFWKGIRGKRRTCRTRAKRSARGSNCGLFAVEESMARPPLSLGARHARKGTPGRLVPTMPCPYTMNWILEERCWSPFPLLEVKARKSLQDVRGSEQQAWKRGPPSPCFLPYGARPRPYCSNTLHTILAARVPGFACCTALTYSSVDTSPQHHWHTRTVRSDFYTYSHSPPLPRKPEVLYASHSPWGSSLMQTTARRRLSLDPVC
jgi:hypothetical protein